MMTADKSDPRNIAEENAVTPNIESKYSMKPKFMPRPQRPRFETSNNVSEESDVFVEVEQSFSVSTSKKDTSVRRGVSPPQELFL